MVYINIVPGLQWLIDAIYLIGYYIIQHDKDIYTRSFFDFINPGK